MKACVMQLVVTLRPGGAERLALSLLERGKGAFRGCVAGLQFPAGDLRPMAEAIGVPSFTLEAERLSKPGALLALYRLLRAQRVTLLHAQAAWLLPYALLAAKAARVPVVYTEHSTHELETLPRLRRTARLGSLFTAGVVCVSEHLAEYFRDGLGIAPKRLRVIPNGVDLGRFSPEGERAPLPWSCFGENGTDAPFVFGTVARLCEDKDHETLLRAFALVSAAHPRARLLIVGDGEKRAELEALIAELGLTRAVHLAGMRLDVPAWLRSMSAFVLSSKWEGFPLAVLEAMACGLPAASTGVGGIPNLNQSRENLLLVPPRNPVALAEAMERLLLEKGLRERLRSDGRDLVNGEYSLDRMAERYFSLYEECGGLA